MTLMIMTFKHQDTQHLCRELLVKIPHVMEKGSIQHVKDFCSRTGAQNHKAAPTVDTHNTFPLICCGEQNLETIAEGSQGQKF